MPSSSELRHEADSAEQIARVLSYTKDKVRFRDQAADLRRRADEIDRDAAAPPA
jgi:hypothetical protein